MWEGRANGVDDVRAAMSDDGGESETDGSERETNGSESDVGERWKRTMEEGDE